MLEPAGVADFEETVLRALLAAGRRTAGELAGELAGALSAGPGAEPRVSADDVGKALLRLVDLGLAVPDGPGFLAVDPRAALTGVLRERRSELDRAARTVDALSAVFHDRARRGADPGSGPVEAVGAAEGAERLRHALARAEREVVAFGMPPFELLPFGFGGPGEFGDAVSEVSLLARRVACRAVYATAALDVPERTERIRALATLGGQARVAAAVPLTMAVVDRREAVIAVSDLSGGGAGAESAIVVRQTGLCDALAALFEMVWAQAAPLFAPARAGAGPDLDLEDRAILQLLNAGMTDDVIGRQLGVSERTVRRRVAELAARLGAGSRFQIGAQAVRRGWLA